MRNLDLPFAVTVIATFAVAALGARPVHADPVENDKVVANCIACHGAELEGVEGMGVGLAESAFISRKSVPELVAFLKVGRMPGDPESVMDRPMPGFGWLPEADLVEIATYLKGRQGP